MDWIRRNWPDMLIGIALIAVIAGIVVTLLSGGSLLPFGKRQTASLPPPPSTALGSSTSAPTVSGGGRVQTAVGPAGQAASGGGVIPVAPGSSAAAGPAGAASAGSSTQQAASAASGGAGTTTGVPLGAPSYRISVAAVHDANSANQLADKLKGAGYPAFVGQQGDLSLVLVGPYANRNQADTTADKLKGDGYDTLIYTYEGTQTAAASGAGTATSGASAASPTSGAATATTPAPPTAPAATSGTYLQVGAYATLDSAQPQIQRLQQLGYTVSQRQEGDLIKLLIGPFGAEQLSAAESQLQAQGMDFFPRH